MKLNWNFSESWKWEDFFNNMIDVMSSERAGHTGASKGEAHHLRCFYRSFVLYLKEREASGTIGRKKKLVLFVRKFA